eukprot:scaffold9.g3046.t1
MRGGLRRSGGGGGRAGPLQAGAVPRSRLHASLGRPRRRHRTLTGGSSSSNGAGEAQSFAQVQQQAPPTPQQQARAQASAPQSQPPPPPQQPEPPEEEEEAGHEPEAALILVACGIGLATGAGIVSFNDAVHAIREAIWSQELGGMAAALAASARGAAGAAGASDELWPRVVFPPVVGGLAVGALGLLIGGYEDRSPSSAAAATAGAAAPAGGGGGGGWRAQLQAVARPLSRAVAASITLGTGASLGPEGPSVDIGRSVAKGLGSTLRSRSRHLSALLAAGSGAGVAAGFNAPVAGVFFAVETVLQKQQQQLLAKLANGGADARAGPPPRADESGLTVAMVLLASVLAAVVSQAGLGSSPAFRVPAYRLESMYELPLYLGIRVASDAFEELRQQHRLEGALLPGVGGLVTGVLALGYPEVLYQARLAWWRGALWCGVLWRGVAWWRGVLWCGAIWFAPSPPSPQGFDNVNNILSSNNYAPGLLAQAYALVGVGAMLASNCAVPLTAVLLLIELTRDYLVILPTLAAVGISFWVSSLAAPSVRAAAGARAGARAVPSDAAAGLLVGRPPAAAGGGAGGAGGDAAPAGSAARRRAPADPVAVAVSAAAAVVGATAALAKATESRDVEGGPLVELSDSDGPPQAALGLGLAGGAAAAGGAAGGALTPAALAAAAAAAGGAPTVAAAMERSCLVVQAAVAMEDALALMAADDQHVAVVVAPDGAVLGVVSREVLQECVAAAVAAAARAAAGANGAGGDGGGQGEEAAAAAAMGEDWRQA